MDFDSTRLRIFMTVAERGSFTEAARRLDITQPAVSQNIAELEKALGGGSLFVRSRTAVTLTERGEEFRRYAERILFWCDEVERRMVHPDTSARKDTVLLDVDNTTAAEIKVSDGGVNIRFVEKH